MGQREIPEILQDLIKRNKKFMLGLEKIHTQLAKIRETRVPTAEEKRCFQLVGKELSAVREATFRLLEEKGRPRLKLVKKN